MWLIVISGLPKRGLRLKPIGRSSECSRMTAWGLRSGKAQTEQSFPFAPRTDFSGGVELFLVPLLIAPAYFGCGYLAWSLAHIFVGVFGDKLRAEQIWRVPLVAAFVMVMWDLTMKSSSSRVSARVKITVVARREVDRGVASMPWSGDSTPCCVRSISCNPLLKNSMVHSPMSRKSASIGSRRRRSLLAQPEPLPERLVSAAPDAVVD